MEGKHSPQRGPGTGSGRFIRVGETARLEVPITVDGRSIAALEGDTLLVALLDHVGHLRHSEFGDGARSGFCLMGACQDCWVRSESGERLRACTTVVRPGMRIRTLPMEATWPSRA
jgi:predicted molibdopterin-dependent oxidoreductase YjgC